MSTPSPWQIVSIAQKLDKNQKPYDAVELQDRSMAKIKVNLFGNHPAVQIGTWINCVVAKKPNGYWEIEKNWTVCDQALQPTQQGISVLPPPIVLPTTISTPKNDQPKIVSNAEEQYMYDELLKIVFVDCNGDDEKNISQHEFDECLSDKIKEYGITKLQAMKMFMKDNNLTVKPQPKPETKEEMMVRMAKERDTVNRELIDVLKCLCVRIKALEEKMDIHAVLPTTEGAKK